MEIKNVILEEELKNVTLEKDGNLAVITINRPKALNALNSDTLKDLDKAITNIENDSNVYCVILTGAGEKSFVAGADIAEMKDLDSKGGEEFGLLGAMACDIRIASEKAKFAQPEAGLGITPGFGGTQRLPRIVGLGKAKELIYTCAMINAEEALRIGLVNKVVPLENLMEEAKKMAATICANAPIAVKLCKDAINRGMQVDIDKAIEIEAEDFGKCFDSEDQVEGMTAFLERRAKNFQNK